MSGQFWVTVQCPVAPASLCSIGFKPDCLLVLGDDLLLKGCQEGGGDRLTLTDWRGLPWCASWAPAWTDRQGRAGVHLYHSSMYCLQRSPSALLQGWGKAGETEVYSWK